MTEGAAVVVPAARALPLARRIAAALPGAAVHAPAGAGDAAADVTFPALGPHLAALFAAGVPIIGLCAAGILIRLLAPHLKDKHAEPPVVAVAEDGSAVVPLLGGHRGANRLARTIAGALGCPALVTTAGDAAFGIALDDPPPGYRLANPDAVRGVAKALLDGAAVRIEGGPADWLAAAALPVAADAALALRVTERAAAGDADTLVYHPEVLAVGVGAERGAAPEALAGLVRDSLRAAGLAEAAVALVASLDLKADEPAVHAAAAALGVPARFLDAATLEAETPRLANPSDAVFRAVGCHGVAEAAALAAAGPDGVLVVPKCRGDRVTCAVARAPQPIEAAAVGRPQGVLAVVGTGPGQPAWRPPETAAWLQRASDVVGYRLYLDLLEPLPPGVRRHDFDLGEETVRARFALDLAAAGRTVALVSSGDPGLYAMAAVVFELLDGAARPDWHRTAIVVCPGISAMQAAAARAGAPLGHDFCAISLSDLLTPWPAIERRIEAAAAADFVVAFYNPVSRQRSTQLARAKALLLAHRPPATPTILARNLGRPGESVRVTTLGALDPAAVDMLTLVLVGSSATRTIPRAAGEPWVYTPRGYGDKPGGGRG